MFGLIDAWSIGGVGDVEANGDIWAQAVGDHFGAIAADFFLDGIDGVDGGGGAFFLSGEACHDLGDDETAEAVVERATDKMICTKEFCGVRVDRGMSDAQTEGGDFCGVGGADVDVQFMDFGGFFRAVTAVANMDGCIADQTGD